MHPIVVLRAAARNEGEDSHEKLRVQSQRRNILLRKIRSWTWPTSCRLRTKGRQSAKIQTNMGFRLNVENSPQSFVVGDQVDLEKFSIFRAFPDSGAPFAQESRPNV